MEARRRAYSSARQRRGKTTRSKSRVSDFDVSRLRNPINGEIGQDLRDDRAGEFGKNGHATRGAARPSGEIAAMGKRGAERIGQRAATGPRSNHGLTGE